MTKTENTTTTRKRLNPAVYSLLTGVVFIIIGFLWNQVVDILIDIEGFGLGDIIYLLPYAGYAVIGLGVLLIFVNIIRMVITKPVVKEVVPVKKKVVNPEEIKETSKFEKKFVKGLIFDLDGTLLHTLDDLADAGNNVLATLGYPIQDAELFRISLGNGLRNLMKNVLPPEVSEEEVDKAYQGMVQMYAQNYMNKTKAYPGIQEMIEQLAKRGYLMAVVSNKKDEFTKELVKVNFPDVLFVDVIGDQVGVQRKPDPSLARVVSDKMMLPTNQIAMIGDSEVDIMWAKNANMYSFAVTWGYRTEEELKPVHPNVFVTSPQEVVMKLDMINTQFEEA